MADRRLQVIAVDDLDFLESHDATLSFSVGKKIGLEYWLNGGRFQASGWSVGEVINAVRDQLRRRKDRDST